MSPQKGLNMQEREMGLVKEFTFTLEILFHRYYNWASYKGEEL